MQEIKGNLWDYFDKGECIAITTNGDVKKNGLAVMGRGVALEARNRVRNIDKVLGDCLKVFGNQVFVLAAILPNHEKIVTFPTKNHWQEASDPVLISRSAQQLAFINEKGPWVYLPRPGCGNGGLNWTQVRQILEKYLNDRFVVVS